MSGQTSTATGQSKAARVNGKKAAAGRPPGKKAAAPAKQAATSRPAHPTDNPKLIPNHPRDRSR